MRKALIMFQFGLSVVFVISTLVAIDQLRLVRSTPLGVRTEGVLSVPLEGVDFSIFRQRIAAEPDVLAVSGAAMLPAVSGGWPTQLTRSDPPITKSVRYSAADAGFLPVFGLRLLAGSNFPETAPPANETLVLLNATAARDLGYGDPEQAVGRSLAMSDGKKAGQAVRVVGVVEDFTHSKITLAQGAFALCYRPDWFSLAILRVNADRIKPVVERLQRMWASFDSAAPFAFTVFTDDIEQALLGAKVMMKSVRFVSLLAVLVSCLGLVGIADYSSRVRRREVGIRKVCGAGEWSLVKLLSRSYLGMLAVAAAFGVPAAWEFNRVILSVYGNERVTALRPGVFAAGAGIVAALGMIVVLSQTIRAAKTNPADIIRSE